MNILLLIEIFFARILDVSIGVIRTVELVKDNTLKSSILAFFEVFIWFCVAREALTTNEFNILVAISYSLGYATGTLIGSYLSRILIRGSLGIQIITNNITDKEIKIIKDKGYGISSLSLDNKKKMLLIEVDKRRLKDLLTLIKKLDNKAFITISETRSTKNGYIK